MRRSDARRQRGGALLPSSTPSACAGGIGGDDVQGIFQRERQLRLRPAPACGEGLQRQQGQVQRDPEHGASGSTERQPRSMSGHRERRHALRPVRSGRRRAQAASESTGGSASTMGASRGGPRRLSTRSASASGPAARSERRSGATLGRSAAAARASQKAAPSCACAASCRRQQAFGAQPRRQPGEQRTHVAALERLLEGPEPVVTAAAGLCLHHQQLRHVQPELRQRPGRAAPADRTASPAGHRAARRRGQARQNGSRRCPAAAAVR